MGIESEDRFQSAWVRFYQGCQAIKQDYFTKNFPTLQPSPWRADHGKRYIRVVSGDGVHCFVDKTNGDVLKADGWKRPAKHARGNIFDENNGLGLIGPYGPAYLR